MTLGSTRLFQRFTVCFGAAALCCALIVVPAVAQGPQQDANRVGLETSEVLFSTLAAINMCGYDQDLTNSDPLRTKVRAEISEVLQASSAASDDRDRLCQYYRDKQQPDASRDLSQYVSLALNLGPAPGFQISSKEADLPPDAANLLGFIPLLQRFYDSAGLGKSWARHQREYETQIARQQQPVAKMILNTGLYLKMPLSNYVGRKFVVYLEPMGAAGQTNARNYGPDYYLVASPAGGELRMDQIRHTYLHFTLDPLVQKRANQLKRLDPILELVKSAPVDEAYKHDASLMVIESLIRAIEARTIPAPAPTKDKKNDAKAIEAQRNEYVNQSMEFGYVLTQYFYEQMETFEKEPTGLQNAFGTLLTGIDLSREKKRISEISFSAQASPDVVRASNPRRPQMLDLAEQRLGERDFAAAHRIAQQVLDQKTEDPARALFILARASILNKDGEGARVLFERTLEVAKEPRTVAWSHIYLARIMDLKCNREAALTHYKAAMIAGDPTPDTKTAVDKGISTLPPNCGPDDK